MEKIEELLKLIKENPDLPVKFMTNTEVVADDCYDWWMGSIQRIEKDTYAFFNDRVHFGEEAIKEEIYDILPDGDKHEDAIEREIEENFKAMEKSGVIEEAIIVYINT